jgi:hypothetical protein
VAEHNEGGSAFPCDISAVRRGMTLRDYFAAKAMQALIASNDEGAGDRLQDIPGYAYDIADAMLKARGA